MKRALAIVLLVLGWSPLAVREAAGCTTFCLRGGSGAVFGRNYDWNIGHGLVVVNKRGVEKTALLPPGERPARWTSRFGSLTFNQYGREFPTGGMNEAGLVVEVMWLDETRYPAADGQPGLGSLEWVQYQLDRFSTVDEVVRSAGGLRIASDAKLHYLVCERSGRCATIEFLDGKLVARSGSDLPVAALANSPYDESLRFLEKEGTATGFSGPGSNARFARAAKRVRELRGGDPVEHAFQTLGNVAQSTTQWSIVYDQGKGRVYWQTAANPRRRWVDLGSFDLSCAAPVVTLDIDQGGGAMTRRFSPYRAEANRELVTRSFRGTPFLRDVPPQELETVARQPERTTCSPRAALGPR
jgi:penicillin V acylase-like amidase (Ntn superfamily)